MLDKILGQLSLTNISKARELYGQALDVVKTNITTREVLSLVSNIEDEKRFFSFVYTADCDKRYIELTYPGCVLYI